MKVVDWSEVKINKDTRIDTQFWTEDIYYSPNLKYERIGNCLDSAQYGASISMNEEQKGHPIYRMNEIHNMICDNEVSKYADLERNELDVFKLNDKDVLFNRTNSFEWVGRTGIYYKNNSDPKDYVFASYLVRFIPNVEKVLPEYLTAFLNTKFGIKDVKRRARQSINQTNVNPEEVKEIKLPLLSMDLQRDIAKNFDIAYEGLIKSQQKYAEAEKLLLRTLDLEELKYTNETVNIKGFKESFGSTGRLDAEYYQPKYEQFSKLIEKNASGYSLLKSVCNLKDRNFNPLESVCYKYIELSNIGRFGDITGSSSGFGAALPSRARRLVKTGDVIVSSIEGSLDSCALVTEKYNDAICSTGFYVINSDAINSETLLVLFRLELMQSLLKQSCSGTILTAINKNEFMTIPIPNIDITIQQQIEQLIQECFVLKSQSENLLGSAKRAVEIAIEENEAVALDYIKGRR